MSETKPDPKSSIDVRSLLDPPRASRWYDHALGRLPLSLLITLVVVLVGFPLMFFAAVLLLRFLAA